VGEGESTLSLTWRVSREGGRQAGEIFKTFLLTKPRGGGGRTVLGRSANKRGEKKKKPSGAFFTERMDADKKKERTDCKRQLLT